MKLKGLVKRILGIPEEMVEVKRARIEKVAEEARATEHLEGAIDHLATVLRYPGHFRRDREAKSVIRRH